MENKLNYCIFIYFYPALPLWFSHSQNYFKKNFYCKFKKVLHGPSQVKKILKNQLSKMIFLLIIRRLPAGVEVPEPPEHHDYGLRYHHDREVPILDPEARPGIHHQGLLLVRFLFLINHAPCSRILKNIFQRLERSLFETMKRYFYSFVLIQQEHKMSSSTLCFMEE